MDEIALFLVKHSGVVLFRSFVDAVADVIDGFDLLVVEADVDSVDDETVGQLGSTDISRDKTL